MRLVRLIYASKFKKDVNPSELNRIHEEAVAFNSKNHISGILVFGEDFFLQYLEGGREAVNNLYNKITADPRHTSNLILDYSEISERQF